MLIQTSFRRCRKNTKSVIAAALLAVVAVTLQSGSRAAAQVVIDALPEVDNPFIGDARLEPIPSGPIELVNTVVFGDGKALMMRFPPRVNGQTQSDGDKHADLWVLVDETTGDFVQLNGSRHPAILEFVPKNAAGPNFIISDFTARQFSAIWEIHVVTVSSSYDPTNLSQRIDSACKVESSSLVHEIFQTNIFLNCPVVPRGTVLPAEVAPGVPPNRPLVIEEAFFKGEIVEIVPYDVEDGGFNPQILWKFEDSAGNTLPSPQAPHLVAARVPGEEFYSSVWEIWVVIVPDGFDVTTIKAARPVGDPTIPNIADLIKPLPDGSPGFPIKSSHIRLNCPVVAIETTSGVFEPFPFEDAFDFLINRNGSGPGHFQEQGFKFDIAEGPFTPARTFLITEINPGGEGVGPCNNDDAAPDPRFPPIAPLLKGNVIPLLLVNPFPLVPLTDPFPPTSGPNTTGDLIRFSQQDLDDAYSAGMATVGYPLLPPDIEASFNAFIFKKLLSSDWAAGQRRYQDRLALVGRALFETVWKPEQGANSKDVTSCLACHSTPAAGGAARGLYTLTRAAERPEFGPPDLTVILNPGSIFGSGAAELVVQRLKAAGEDVTFAHGSLGQIASIRGVSNGAQNAHFGIQSSEFIQGQSCFVGVTLDDAAATDCDGDGVTNEATVGEITALTVFQMTLPVPREVRTIELRRVLGVDQGGINRGRLLFRSPISQGGAGCTNCHVPFHPLSGFCFDNEFLLSNPETDKIIPIQVSHHFATQLDVDEGYADFVGQPGIKNYGDFKKHEMGPNMLSAGQFGTSFIKTAELWDVGSVFPYLRDGSKGSNLREVILAHGGEAATQRAAFDILLSASDQQDLIDFLRAQLIEGKLGEGSGGEDVNIPEELSLTPCVDFNLLGETHTVTATAIEGNAPNHPVQNLMVVFEIIDGPNAGLVKDIIMTGPDGTATFTYTSNGQPGVDKIMATFLFQPSEPGEEGEEGGLGGPTINYQIALKFWDNDCDQNDVPDTCDRNCGGFNGECSAFADCGAVDDFDSDGIIDSCDPDDDNDGVDDLDDLQPRNPHVCQDLDMDGCDDCTNFSGNRDGLGPDPDFDCQPDGNGGFLCHDDGKDTDGDGICDSLGDVDSDNDGVPDILDSAPLDPNVCRDVDGDGCDDCSVTGADGSGGDPANDGPDADLDGICDSSDNCPNSATADQTDTDGDGLGDACDPDDDNDGVNDADDLQPLNPHVCQDLDTDGCDDCTNFDGTKDGFGPNPDFDSLNDGLDTDGDGICDALGDLDDDNDGVPDFDDADPLDPFVCRDVDGDGCDDCSVTGADGSGGDPANDGPDDDLDGVCDSSDNCPGDANADQADSDGDGEGDACDPDDDNDGVLDPDDTQPQNPFACGDGDGDGCDDCSSGTFDQSNDGTDSDSDGLCDLGDPDDDNDGVLDGLDGDPLDPAVGAVVLPAEQPVPDDENTDLFGFGVFLPGLPVFPFCATGTMMPLSAMLLCLLGMKVHTRRRARRNRRR